MLLVGTTLFAQQARPVVILNEAPVSGAYTQTGLDQTRGTELAIEMYGGKVLGRPIQLIHRDTPNPSESVRRAREVVERFGAEFIQVGTSSSVALAVMEYAREAGVIALVHAGSDSITGENCNEFTFRWQTPTYGAAEEVVTQLMKMGKKTFYTITPEYIFGEDLLKNTKRVLDRDGGKLLGNAYHPLGALEYGSHILSAMAAKPDVILLLNFGADTVNSLKQAVSYGANRRSTLAAAWGGGINELRAVGSEVLEGVIIGQQYYHRVNTPRNKEFVDAYYKRYGEYPPYMAAAGFDQITALLKAIEKAGTTDATAVAKALENLRFGSLFGDSAYYRSCDHNLIKPYLTLRAKSVKEKEYPDDFAEIISQSSIYVPCDKSDCKMGR
jgi:branched-chain amino acid transport system substrate-binding protein